MASTFAIDGYVLIEDAIAASDLESLKRELEDEAPPLAKTAIKN